MEGKSLDIREIKGPPQGVEGPYSRMANATSAAEVSPAISILLGNSSG